MGSCSCGENKNIIYPNEVMVPLEGETNEVNKEQENSVSKSANTKIINEKLVLESAQPIIPQEEKSIVNGKIKQIKKNIIMLSTDNNSNNNSSLTHLFKQINCEIENSSTNHSQNSPYIISKHLSEKNLNNPESTDNEDSKKKIDKSPSKSPLLERTKTLMTVENHQNKSEFGLQDKSNENNNNENKNKNYSVNEVVFSEEDLESLKEILRNHFIFMRLANNVLEILINKMSLFQIEKDYNIFKEGEISSIFFIINKGKVEIKSKNKKKVLQKGETFGEIALFNNNFKRNYSAVSKSQVELFCLTKELYNQILKEENLIHSVKEMENKKKQFDKDIKDFYLFSNLTNNIKDNLFLLSKYYSFTENNKCLVSNIYGSKSKYNKKNNNGELKKPYFSSYKTLLFPVNGEIIVNYIVPEMSKKSTRGKCAGLVYLIFKAYEKSEFEIFTNSDESSVILINENIFIECMGLNYQYDILLSFFTSKISKSEIINKFISKNVKENSEKLLSSFPIKEYKSKDIVISKNSYENKKFIIVLTGELINSKTNKTIISLGAFYGDKLINSREDLDYDILAKKTPVLVFECSWKDLKTSLQELPENKSLFEDYENLSKIRMFNSYNESDLFSFAKKFHKTKTKFKENDVIIKEGTVNKFLYLLAKGRVKLKNSNDQTFRVYDEGNCFGEQSLLNETANNFTAVADEHCVCYLLSTDQFFEFVADQHNNDFIKQKMLMEDLDINLSDLYYVSYLGRGRFGNVCLVHNTMCFYAAKAISKIAAEKQKTGVKNLINEKKTLISVDHPFVVKIVKTLKKDGWCFLLMEFIQGKNFGEYLDNRKQKRNLYETKFFGACLFEIISYLNKRYIIHRDIKPTNIMLDITGYLKLIDFGTARKLTPKNYSNTIIGTPNFIAPEILLSQGYSYGVDYWSIGICIFYIYFGNLPFGQKATELLDIYQEIINEEPKFPADAPFDVKHLILGLLTKDPNERITSLELIKKQKLYKNFPWDDLLNFKLKPFVIPCIENRIDPEYLNNTDSPFETFMENEKFETIQMQTLKIHNTKEVNRCNSIINAQWFNEF